MPFSELPLPTQKGLRCGLWHIEESEEELHQLYQPEASEVAYFSRFRHAGKRQEFLAARLALKYLMDNPQPCYNGVGKAENGKPFLRQSSLNCSLSHCAEVAGAALLPETAVGIDLEPIHPKILRVRQKFARPEELARWGADLQSLVKLWCAKEAIYKLFGWNHIFFKDHIQILDEQNGRIVHPQIKADCGLWSGPVNEKVWMALAWLKGPSKEGG